MRRRAFLKTGMGMTAAVAMGRLVPGRSALAAEPDEVKWRTFEVVTRAEITDPTGPTRVWIPLAVQPDTDYLKSLGQTWTGNAAVTRVIREEKYGAAIFYAEWPATEKAPVVEVTTRVATHDRMVDVTKPGRNPTPEDRAALNKYRDSTKLIRTDGIVSKTAQQITKGIDGDVEKARAIYEWIVENTFRDPKVRGCGWGDIKGMLETGNLGGKCGDLNALFVGLARSVGVPARDIYGLRVAKSEHGYLSLGANTESVTRAQHCRAEFWSETHGWVPVDPADVRKVVLEEPPGNLPLNNDKVRVARERLFGYWEMNWLAYNRGHDIAFPGATGGWKVPYFMYPDGQTAKGRLDPLDPDRFQYTMTAKELKS